MSLFLFKKTALGIDIFDEAVEIVLLEKRGSKISLLKKARAIFPKELVVQGKIQDKKIFAEILRKLFVTNKINLADQKLAVFGLPDGQSYVYSFVTKVQAKGDYSGAVVSELIKIVPIESENLVYGYNVLSEDKENAKIISVAGDQKVVSDWQDLFHSLGLENIIIAPEKTATTIGKEVSLKVGLTIKAKSILKKVDQSDKEYDEALGLAISALDKDNHKIPFFINLKSKSEIPTEIITAPVINPVIKSANVEKNSEEIVLARKLKKQKILLGSILILGIILVGIASYYQSIQEQKRLAELESKRTNFTVVQTFDIDVPIALDINDKTIDQASGQAFVDDFKLQGAKSEAISVSRSRAAKEVGVNEKLWSEPVSVSSSIAPSLRNLPIQQDYSIIWIIYNDNEVNTLATSDISNTLNAKDIKFAISNIQKKAIRSTDNPEIYLLTVSVSIALEKNIDNVIIN